MNHWTKIAEIEIHYKSGWSSEEIQKNIRTACGRFLKKKEAVPLGLQRYTSVPMHRDIFLPRYGYIVYWTNYRDIYDTFTYASTNMGKQSLISAHPLPAF